MKKEEHTEQNIGRIVEGYQILAVLGTGATSQVYQVRENATGRIYAMKYSIHTDLLHQESEVLKKLNHPCFPQWIAEGMDSRSAYLIMEYISGMTLQQLMAQYPTGMPQQMAAGIGLDVAAGLAYLHDLKPSCIYRDMKAANVIITTAGRARVIDLGALTYWQGGEKTSYRAGTYGYGAPEQFWTGVEITPACDVYGLGKLLSFLLTGQDPGKPPYDTALYCSRHAGVRGAFRQLLDHCLEQDPQLRYPDASFLLPVLSELAGGRGLRQTGIRTGIATRLKTGIATGIGVRLKEGIRKKSRYRYIKCIWMSEYERIF